MKLNLFFTYRNETPLLTLWISFMSFFNVCNEYNSQIMLSFEFSCSICVVIILAILKLGHPWTHKSWRAEKLYSDKFWHGESENHT